MLYTKERPSCWSTNQPIKKDPTAPIQKNTKPITAISLHRKNKTRKSSLKQGSEIRTIY